MAGSVDIRATLVDGRVDDETGCVDQLVGATNAVSVLVNVNHVGNCEEGKVYAVRIDPEGVWMNGISKTDVSTSTISEPKLCKDTKRTRHLFELPLSRRFLGFGPGNVVSALSLAIRRAGPVEY